MTVTNTSLLGLALPTTGTESGVWGDDVNNGLTILIDVSVAGTNNITQNSDITLAVSNGNNSSSFTSTATNSAVAQYYVLNCSGARTALTNIIVPTTSKTYVVTNGTTGGFGITVKKSGGTGVTVAAGETAIVFYNTVTGDVAKVTSTVNVSSFSAGTTGLTPSTATTGAVTLAGTLATTNGGTGLTSFTSGGVVYASSTSALVTGSALTFDGTNLSLLPSGYSVFGASSAEQMRLTSTGLGIGTSSPSQKLAVAGGIASTAGISALAASTTFFDFNSGIGRFAAVSGTTGTAAPITLSQYSSNGSVGRDAVYIDTSGNFGLGVTPSAWASPVQTALQLKGGASFASWGSYGGAYTVANAFYNGTNWKYLANNLAGLYVNEDGAHSWYNAPSGTAGNAITFTQAMTLDASGYLVVGDTATSARFKSALTGASTASITTVSDFGAAGILSLGGVGSNSQGVYLGTGDARTGVNGGIAAGIGFLREASGWNSALAFYTNGTTDGTTTNRITERARIDSSGNLLVGTTAGGATDSNSFSYAPSSVKAVDLNHATGTTTGTNYARFNYAGSTIGSITQSGTTAVLYNVTSDQRLKENIQDADSASTLIDSLQVRKFDWKADGNHQRYGFVAQELVTVAPEAVHQPTNPDDMMAVDYSKLVPMLVKEIQSLRQRLSAANL